jgi:hypothetical protein
MAKLNTEATLKRADRAFENQSRYTGLWDLAYRYTFPQKDILSQTPGSRRGIQVYDSTAPDSAIRLANRMQQDMFPPGQEWAIFDAGKDVPDQMRDQARKILQDTQGKFFELMHASNFDDAINEAIQEMIVGTGTLLFQEGDFRQVFKFQSVTITAVAIDDGPLGAVDGCFVKMPTMPRLIKAMFPKADAIPPELEARALDPNQSDKPVELVYCVYHDYETGTACHDVIWRDQKKSLFSKPMEEATSPWLVFRWAKNAQECYGYGPPISNLPTILSTNKVMEFTLKGAAFRITPMTTVANDGTNLNMWRIEPGAALPVHTNDTTRPSIAPFDFGGDPQLSELVLTDLRAIIKRGFHDNSLPPDTGPVRSAYEIATRMKELNSDIGGVFGRLQRELVTPLVLRGLDIMQRRGLINYPLVINGTTVKVIPKSPLSQLQNVSRVEAVVQWLQIVQGMGPEVAMIGAKVEDIPHWIGEQLGVPEILMRTSEEREKFQQDIAQIIAQQNAAQQPQQPPATGGRPNLVAAQ